MRFRHTSNKERVKVLAREDAARRLNHAANTHVEVSQGVVPRDTEALAQSIKVTEHATRMRLRAEVEAGGYVVDSGPNQADFVAYAEPVERGHATANGGYVAGVFYFQQGFEAARKEVEGQEVIL